MSIEIIELDGQPCVLALTNDITELKLLEEQLRRSQKMEALGRLAGGVAHDFNNLLTAISGYASLMIEGLPASTPVRASAEHIQRAAARAASLTHQLLVFGRQQPRQPIVLDLNTTISSLLHMLRRLIGEDIRLETSLGAELGFVEADPAQIEQVVMNLALNARDAMPKGGQLHIETATDVGAGGAPWVRLSVQDGGVGMDAATRARIFEPFFTTKQPGKGTGLGLATVYGVVEQARGRIAVHSEPGRGTRFDILLPRTSARPSRPAVPHPPAPASVGGTILVVEDDEAVSAFVTLVLQQARYTVLAATDGTQALEVAGRHSGHIDLLLTDIVMPEINGRALAHALRRTLPRLRVMYMSGYPGDTIERYGDIPSGEPFLQKPFTRELLLGRVAELLERIHT
jgi:nitrogen-specific signal transduction histidine kinase/CheY-like chemotaxis protein